MDTAILSVLSALGGAALGAVASISTTWLSQHYQDRSQRRAQDTARRERLFSDFINLTAKLFGDALTHELTEVSMLAPLYALRAQICVFANSRETVQAADHVMQRIVDTYYAPNRDFRNQPDMEPGRDDILEVFTVACREELRVGASRRAPLRKVEAHVLCPWSTPKNERID